MVPSPRLQDHAHDAPTRFCKRKRLLGPHCPACQFRQYPKSSSDPIVQLHNISIAFGGDVILDRVSWTVSGQKRIGLVGPNGAGKTTLLKIINGELTPDSGNVSTSGLAIGYLKQETQEQRIDHSVLDEALLAFESVLDLHKKEHDLLEQLEASEVHEGDAYGDLLLELDRVHERLRHSESHLMKPRAEAVLSGLGFDAADQERPLSTFSGGWRMRAALARLLLTEPHVLLLDEPTNHLDIDSIDWLESHLKTFRGSVVIVSHDRYFLDRMITQIAELHGGALTEYAGNYEFYLRERAERRIIQQAAWENQQKMIADTERFIERFRAKASKARQVQSRVKSLESLERIPPPPSDEASISFRFPAPPRSNRTVLDMSAFSKRYETDDGEIVVFDQAGPIQIERGDRIALIGRNGAGKSTLSRMLAGSEPFEGARTLGSSVELTFFAQNQAESLPANRTAFEAVQESAYGQSETWIRTLLGAFLFRGDDVFKPISVLSGGERSRVALAKTLVSPANFLILDEPTNHLDIMSRQVLVEALNQYTGTYVIVSHDRHFLDHIARKVWRVEDGTVRQFHGNYSDYLWQIQHGTAGSLESARTTSTSNGETKDSDESKPRGPKSRLQKREEAEERTRKRDKRRKTGANKYASLNDFKLNRMHTETETRIQEMEETRSDLDAQISDPEVFSDLKRARDLTTKLAAVQSELESLYQDWATMGEEMENRKFGD